jgi:hypothetical protein
MLHLVPQWQSSDRHVKLKTIMQDRPDLIESELSGLAFDSNQQIFKTAHIEIMFSQTPPTPALALRAHAQAPAGAYAHTEASLAATRISSPASVSSWLGAFPSPANAFKPPTVLN